MKTITELCKWAVLLCASLCLLAAARALWSIHLAAQAIPVVAREAVGSLNVRMAALQDAVEGLPHQILPPLLIAVDAESARAQDEIRHAVNVSAVVLNDAVARSDARVGDTLKRVDTALGEVHELRGQLQPVLANAATVAGSINTLAVNYAALPDRLSYANRWLWDCHEFSGCLQSQTLALVGSTRYTLGKVARASDQFPALSTSIQGIAADAHGWTNKYVMPHPMTTGDYFKAAGKITIGLGTAALRGGLF